MPRSVQDPLTTSAVTIEGTLNVLLAARDEDVRRVVFASSSSVYGNSGTLPRTETQQPDPISPYAVAKLAAERYCVSFQPRLRARDGRAALLQRLRPAPGPALAVRRRRAALHRRDRTTAAPVPIHGDGEQSRDFTYVDNVVEANLLAGDADGAGGTVLNVATGRQASVNELADAIGAVLGKPVEKEYLPVRTGDVRDSWADVSEAQRVLGYEPRVGLEDGLELVAAEFVAAVASRGASGTPRTQASSRPWRSAGRTASPRSTRRRSSRSRNQRNMSIRGFLLRDPVRLRQVARLVRARDAEDPVGRVRLVAVLGDPDPLVAVEARHLADQEVDVAERDRGRRVAVVPGGGGVAASRSARRSTGGARRRRTSSRPPSSSRAGTASGDTAGRAEFGLLLPRGPVTPQATFEAPSVVMRTPLEDRVADLRVVDRALDHGRAA